MKLKNARIQHIPYRETRKHLFNHVTSIAKPVTHPTYDTKMGRHTVIIVMMLSTVVACFPMTLPREVKQWHNPNDGMPRLPVPPADISIPHMERMAKQDEDALLISTRPLEHSLNHAGCQACEHKFTDCEDFFCSLMCESNGVKGCFELCALSCSDAFVECEALNC